MGDNTEHKGREDMGETYIFYMKAKCPGCTPSQLTLRLRQKHKVHNVNSVVSNRSDSGISDITTEQSRFSFNVNNFEPPNAKFGNKIKTRSGEFNFNGLLIHVVLYTEYMYNNQHNVFRLYFHQTRFTAIQP